jgi:hypothetical protein
VVHAPFQSLFLFSFELSLNWFQVPVAKISHGITKIKLFTTGGQILVSYNVGTNKHEQNILPSQP